MPDSHNPELINALALYLSKPDLSSENKSVIEHFIADLQSENIHYSKQIKSHAREGFFTRAANAVLNKSIIYSDQTFLLEAIRNADINSMNAKGSTPLIIALASGNLKEAELLMALGADLEMALISFASQGHIAGINTLIQLAQLKGISNIGMDNALMAAVENNQMQAVNVLIQQGARVHTKDDIGTTPLMIAAHQGNIPCVRTLVQRGANLEEQDIFGETALIMAAQNKQWQTVHFLIKQCNANIEAKNHDQNTALMLAALESDWQAVKILINLGANVQLKNEEGYTPLMLIASKNESLSQELISKGIITDDNIKLANEKYSFLKTIKKSAHILGFKQHIFDIKPEAMKTHVGYALLKECLEKSSSLFQPNELVQIQQALNVTLDCLQENYLEINFEKLIERHQTGNPTIIPISWRGHDLTILMWNNVLVLCNRGEEGLKNSISVFRIPEETYKKDDMLRDFLNSVMPKNQIRRSSKQTLESIYTLIGKNNIENPILTFPSQEQQYGTCAFVNPKSSIHPFLCFLKLLESQGTKPADFNYEFLAPFLEEVQNDKTDQFKKIKHEATTQYKQLTNTIRNQCIHELCDEFKTFPAGSLARSTYIELFVAILNAHHGQAVNSLGKNRTPEKIKAEKERALEILSLPNLMPREKQKLLLTLLPDVDNFIEWVREGIIDVNIKTDIGNNALLLAIEAQNVNAVDTLLKLGADMSITSSSGRAAMERAKEINNEAIIHLLENAQQSQKPKAPVILHLAPQSENATEANTPTPQHSTQQKPF